MALNKTLMRGVYRAYLSITEFNCRPLLEKEAYQYESLDRVLRTAFARSRFYRQKWSEYGIRPDQVRADNIRILPVTLKEEMRERFNDCFCRPLRVDDVICKSGGTTGIPFQYVLSRQQYYNERGVMFWGWSLAGWKPGDRVGYIDNVGLGGVLVRIKNSLKHMHCESMYDLSLDTVPRILHRLARFQPKWLRSVPSALYEVVQLATEAGLVTSPIESLKGIFLTGEMLYGFQREAIVSYFGVPVYDHYGAGDGGIAAFQGRPRSVYIMDMYRTYVETDSDGNILVTSLDGDVFPFIRYMIGDKATIERNESVGATVISKLEGREFESIRLRNGRVIQGLYFVHLLNEVDGIRQYKVVQRDLDHLEFQVVPVQKEGVREVIERSILSGLSEDIVQNISIDVRFVPELRRDKRKFVYVERRF